MLNPTEHILQIYEAKLDEERAKKAAKTRKPVEDKPSTSCSNQAVEAGSAQKKEEVQKNEKRDEKSTIKNGLVKRAEKRKADTNKPVSIQDSSASAAYKSLFTTCEEAKRKPEPHWVTHNPLFY
ncbi:unnamed protein product [Gongylonema pulchrum]|uniref:NAM-associated domain-containing protein n=1 Tax=Gongylonema pulchrum TaxID=637853 RepID=A0A183EN35_9BILA|nr:unnamed protein product [Gongylonema pulchrum]